MKYKLIKEYPGSPKLGNTIDNLENDWIENYSEFWQEIVEKDYEILSFINPENLIYKKGNNNRFDANYQMYRPDENDCLKEPGFKIHSIKRLSDGEIFTIGDKINNTTFGGNGTIKSIRNIENNFIVFRIDFDKEWDDADDSECFLINLQKIKQPLFTTENGVDIFEGDNIYWVNINTFEKVNCNKYNDDLGEISIKSLLSKKYECKAVGFSTKEKAEEYIIMNKPCLSINDVLKLSIDTEYSYTFQRLKELVKSKI